MRPPAALLVLPALLALAPAGAAQDTVGQGQGTVTLEPGEILHPLPANLGQGDAIVFTWSVVEPAGGRLFFSTHIHIGQQLVNLTEEVVPGKDGRLTADRPGLYSLLWENGGNASATFRYSFHTERVAPAPTPVPALLAAAALAGGALAAGRRPG